MRLNTLFKQNFKQQFKLLNMFYLSRKKGGGPPKKEDLLKGGPPAALTL